VGMGRQGRLTHRIQNGVSLTQARNVLRIARASQHDQATRQFADRRMTNLAIDTRLILRGTVDWCRRAPLAASAPMIIPIDSF